MKMKTDRPIDPRTGQPVPLRKKWDPKTTVYDLDDDQPKPLPDERAALNSALRQVVEQWDERLLGRLVDGEVLGPKDVVVVQYWNWNQDDDGD